MLTHASYMYSAEYMQFNLYSIVDLALNATVVLKDAHLSQLFQARNNLYTKMQATAVPAVVVLLVSKYFSNTSMLCTA